MIDLGYETSPLRFSIPPSPRVASAAFFVLAVVLGVLGLSGGEATYFALMAGALAVGFLFGGRPRIEGAVEAGGGIVLRRPAREIPPGAIRSIEPIVAPEGGDEPGSFPIRVEHSAGRFTIPASPSIDSAAIHRALVEHHRPEGSDAVVPELADYAGRHRAMFGDDRVLSYRANPDCGRNIHVRSPLLAIGLGMLAVGIAGFVAPRSLGLAGGIVLSPWPVVPLSIGIALVVSGLVAGRLRFRGIARWRESGLVLTPVGLALIQGPVRGELPWEQLRDVKYRKRRGGVQPHFRLSSAEESLRGIHLVVDGARIVVVDLYDRPIDVIHREIVRRWRPEPIEAPAPPEFDDL